MQDILYSLLRTTFLLTVCGGVCFLALRKTEDRLPHLSRFLWLAVLLSGWFWLQPVVQIPFTHLAGTPRSPENPAASPPAPLPTPLEFEHPRPVQRPEIASFPEPIATASLPPVVETKPFDWKPWLFKTIFAVWVGGMVVSIFLAAAGYLRFLSRLRKTVPAGEDFAGPWRRLLEEHGLDARSIPMFVSDGRENLGPALIRTVRGYRLIIPNELWSELSEAGRCGILKHELEHFRRRDVWKSLFVRVLALPHWFNPIAHLAVHRVEEAAERLCDRAAFGVRREGVFEFAKTLLLLHENAPTQFVARQSIFGRGLKHRVACLLQENHEQKVSTMKKILLISGAVVLLTACLFRIEFVEKIAAEPLKTEVPVNEPESVVPVSTEKITGRVFAEAEKPAIGVIVRIIGETAAQDRETTTNENGEFALEKPQDASFFGMVYAVDADGKRIGEGRWSMNAKTGEIKSITIPLQKADRIITGTVADPEGRPAEGILVAGSYQTVRSEIVRTDKEGKFQFLYPEKLSLLRLIAFKKGVGFDICPTEEIDPYQPMGEVAVTPPDKISNGPFHLKLAPIEPVKIRVVDQDGKPLVGAGVNPWLIQKPCELPKPEPVMWGSPYAKERHAKQFNTSGLNWFDALTDADGIATIDTVPKNFLDDSTFNAHGPLGGVVQPDGSKRYYGRAKNSWKEIKIEDGLPTLTLPRQGSVKGTVKLEDGTPVSDVYIGVRWHNGSGGGQQTDKNGEFRLQDNANVIYNLSFDSDKGAAPSVFNYSVGDGSEEKKLEVVLKPGIRLYGKVFMPDGSPAPDFYVTVNEKDPNPPKSFDRTNTDYESRRSGTVYATDTADKYLHFNSQDNPRSGKKKELAVGEYETLLPAVPREYSFRAVKYPDKENPKEITANVSDVRLLGTEKEFKLDFYLSEKGDNNCTPLADTPPPESPKRVTEKKTYDEVSGRVVDEGGKPLEGVLVKVEYARSEDAGKITETKTNADGRFTVKGPFQLETDKENGKPVIWNAPSLVFLTEGKARLKVRIPDDSNEINAVLQPGARLQGRVIDDRTGKGAANTVVRFCDMNALDNQLQLNRDTKTDAEGNYRTPFGFRPGRYVVFVLDENDPKNETLGKIEPVEVTLKNPTFQVPDLHVNQCGWIEGRFLDAETGEPVPMHGVNIDHVCTSPNKFRQVIDMQPFLMASGTTFKARAFPGENRLRLLGGRDKDQIKGLDQYCTKLMNIKPGETVSLKFEVIRDVTVEALGKLPEPVEEEREAAAAVKRLGGWYKVDADNHVVEVNMSYRNLDDVYYTNPQRNTDAVMPFLPRFSRLKSLVIRDGQVTNESAKYLTELTQLESLSWGSCRIGDAGAAQLEGLKKLRKIHMDNAKLTDVSLKVFSKLPELRELSLQGNAFTNRGLEYLQQSKTLEELWWCLGKTKPNDESLAILAKFPNLKKTEIQGADVTAAGFENLARSPSLKKISFEWPDDEKRSDNRRLAESLAKIKTLEVFSTVSVGFSEDEARTLARALPKLKELGNWDERQLQRLRERN